MKDDGVGRFLYHLRSDDHAGEVPGGPLRLQVHALLGTHLHDVEAGKVNAYELPHQVVGGFAALQLYHLSEGLPLLSLLGSDAKGTIGHDLQVHLVPGLEVDRRDPLLRQGHGQSG